MLNREDAAIGGATVVIGGAAVAAATSTNETGPILAFVGALTVAVIAAYTANRRQERALEAERERLDARLRHERSLADVQLSFQRGETDRAELRSILDALAEHLFRVRDEADAAVLIVDFALSSEDPDDEYWRVRLKERHGRLRSENEGVVSQMQRLSLRLGPEGAPLMDLVTRMRTHGQSMESASWDLSGKGLKDMRSERERLNRLGNQFTAEALKFTHARLHDVPTDEPPTETADDAPATGGT